MAKFAEKESTGVASKSATVSLGQNPTRDGSPKPSYNSNAATDLMGFANRDARTTQVLSQPAVLPKLGLSYQRYSANAEQNRSEEVLAHPEYYAKWTRQMKPTTPGIMAFTYEPIFALDTPFLPSEFRDIFQAEYMDMRLFNNMTREFSASDLHVMWCGLAEIKCHIEAIKRILKIVAKMVNHEVNQYYSPEVLLQALGFPMTERQAHENYVNWFTRFNVEVIDQLRAVRWFKDDSIFPGWKRWGAMSSEIYKDTPEYTDFCQLYLFKRQSLWNISSALNDQGVYVWTFSSQGIGDKDSSDSGVTRLNNYIGSLATLVRNLFFDEGSAMVLATINTIADRSKSGVFSFENLDFGNTTWGEEDIPLTYDWNMLLSINNMSITDAFVGAPYIDATNDELRQRCYAKHQSGIGASSGDALILSPKIVNMPNYGATNNDLIAATQWTVVSSTIAATQGPGDYGVLIVPGACGTELILKAQVFAYQNNSTMELTSKVVYGNAIRLSGFSMAAARDAIIDRISLWQDFAWAPMLYIVDDTGALESAPEIMEVIGQMEVSYIADWNTLSDFHKQFVRNFWGYPIKPERSEPFATSYSGTRR